MSKIKDRTPGKIVGHKDRQLVVSVKTLASVGDVTITAPTADQVLTWDAANTQWVNKDGGSGLKFLRITKADYDALGTKDPKTVYLVTP